MSRLFAALAATIFVVACAPNPVRVVTPVSQQAVGANHVGNVEVRIGEAAAEAMARFDEKAAEKRSEAGLSPVTADQDLGERPAQDIYATLPFEQMLPLVIQDVTRDWGLASGRELDLVVSIDTLKTANAGMAFLAGSSDQLAGNVEVRDGTSGEPLGEFYVDVINGHGGLLGMAIRGGGIREKLAQEFALHVSQQLSGRSDKD